MKCLLCGGKMEAREADLKDELLGLPDITLKGVSIRHCTQCGEEETVIPNLEGLHRVLSQALVKKPGMLSKEEIRFLRKAQGWSGMDFARHMGVTPETVSRWENGKEKMGPQAARLLRLLVVMHAPVENYSIDELDNIVKGPAKRMELTARNKPRQQRWELAGA